MTSDTLAIAVFVIVLVATRPLEERAWRAGRISDRTSALLVVGRIPALAVGYALLIGQEPLVVLGLAAVTAAVAAALFPVTLGRLRRSPARPPD